MLEDERLQVKDELFDAAQQMQQLGQQVDTLRAQLEEAATALTEKQAELETKTAEFELVNERLIASQREVAKERETHNHDLDEMLQSFEKQKTTMSTTESSLRTELTAKEKELEELVAEFDATKQSLQSAVNDSENDLQRAATIGQLADGILKQNTQVKQERDELRDLLDDLRSAYENLDTEFNKLRGEMEKQPQTPETMVEQDVTVEKHGSKTRSDLLRRVGEGFKTTEKIKQRLRQVRASENRLKRCLITAPSREILAYLEGTRGDVENIHNLFEEIIRNYFTCDERKTVGFSVEFLKPHDPRQKPLGLQGETVTTRTTIRSSHSPTPAEMAGGRASPSFRQLSTSPIPPTTMVGPISPNGYLRGTSVTPPPQPTNMTMQSPSPSPPPQQTTQQALQRPTAMPNAATSRSMSMLQQLASSIQQPGVQPSSPTVAAQMMRDRMFESP
eukprot:TRINITY_DN85855_c0_g1_i2.p1 TRINITY_DN85855_c0_g1~~TRINITY_DN85855_c0_g1_i2.p1  ORF type:complete len:462 (+),score=89.47 TRINITY_DN85855_c0_g1_i2:43-1386(+)